eukprot:CAMPEP_0170195732 /NCGR_PEP_ID=MMETSP0040_2-20121228/62061_1 /TAXON_ID=641309 /ORGANISM="Lotharella oceanica, Strain CCMP622" /LENGTH=135 /DNA_ID=CAMNT_0010444953 /DNA_START=132 /DNA_END=539 /DNA_ORIENTATION=-
MSSNVSSSVPNTMAKPAPFIPQMPSKMSSREHHTPEVKSSQHNLTYNHTVDKSTTHQPQNNTPTAEMRFSNAVKSDDSKDEKTMPMPFNGMPPSFNPGLISASAAGILAPPGDSSEDMQQRQETPIMNNEDWGKF